MTLQQLRYLLAVANHGSINAAAKELYVSQPSISAAISSLEKEFGFEIFERTNKGILLTPKGKQLLKRAKHLLKDADQISEEFLGYSIEQKQFSVSAQHYTFAAEAFYQLVQVTNFSDYNFSFVETTGNEVIQNMLENKSELGILYYVDSTKEQFTKNMIESALTFHPMFISPQCVMLLKTNPLAEREKLTAVDLKDQVYISFKNGEFNSNYFTEKTSSIFDHGKTINVSDRSDMFYFLHKLNGFTICTNSVHPELNGEDIVTVPLDNFENVTVGYVTRKGEVLSDLGRNYIDIALKLVKQHI